MIHKYAIVIVYRRFEDDLLEECAIVVGLEVGKTNADAA